MNKYEKWYYDICERGKTRETQEYTERHHIVPESFFKERKRRGKKGWVEGNPDDPTNITRLTDREHELAHYLLIKIYKNDKRAYPKVIRAYEMRSMVNQNQTEKRHFSSRRLAGIRAERARLQSEAMRGENNPQYGRRWTDEEKEEQRRKVTGNQLTSEQHAKLVKNTTGKKKPPMTDDHRRKLAENHKSKRGYDCSHTNDTRRKIGEGNKGRKQSDAEKQIRREANLGKKREKKHCEWCHQDVAVNGFARFHGANCHMNPLSPRYNPDKKPR